MLGLLLPFAISCPLSWAWPPAGAPHPPELVAAETVYGEIGQMVSEYWEGEDGLERMKFNI